MFAAVDDVTRQAAKAEREFAGEKEERAYGGQDETEYQEGTAQVARFHGASLEKTREKAKRAGLRALPYLAWC